MIHHEKLHLQPEAVEGSVCVCVRVCVCTIKSIIIAGWTVVWAHTLTQTTELFDWINQEFLELSSLIPTSGVNCIRAMEWRRIGC